MELLRCSSPYSATDAHDHAQDFQAALGAEGFVGRVGRLEVELVVSVAAQRLLRAGPSSISTRQHLSDTDTTKLNLVTGREDKWPNEMPYLKLGLIQIR